VHLLASLLVFVAALWPAAAAAQVPEPETKRVSLFNGWDLTGWKTEHAKARVRDGVIRLESSRGWVRTEQPFADFVLSFEVRVGPRGGKAGVFVRGWPVFDTDDRPTNAFRITSTFPESTGSDAPWERWEIECIGQKFQLRVNGVPAYSGDAVKNPQGHIGLWADSAAEFRALEVRHLNPQPSAANADYVTARAAGVAPPRLLKEVKPAYTSAAMQQRIQGTVWIQAVVDATGSLGRLSVARSLDPDFGLDAAALAAAEQWQFAPGTLDGKPVPVLITIELAFILNPR
jgi:TonB family protein